MRRIVPSKHISKATINIESSIIIIRGERVIFDSDLASIYGVTTKRLNEQVKRNIEKFPPDFAFQLSKKEFANLKSQNATSSSQHGGRRKLPYVFTEHGAIMSANVLNSKQAIQMSVFVVRVFVKMRSFLSERSDLAKELKNLEEKLTKRLDVHEVAIVDVLRRITRLLEPPHPLPEPPKRKIGF